MSPEAEYTIYFFLLMGLMLFTIAVKIYETDGITFADVWEDLREGENR